MNTGDTTTKNTPTGEEPTIPQNTPSLKLTGIDGNAFSVLGAAEKSALSAGWSHDEWSEVYTEATSSDYNQLLQTMFKYFTVS